MAGNTTTTTIDLSTDKGYSIAAAIRGPDFQTNSEVIKHTFTARIRYLAGARDRGRYDIRLRRISTATARELREEQHQYLKDGLTTAALFHYLIHIEGAAFTLGDKKLAELAKIFRVGGAGIEENVLSNERIIELAGGD